MPVIPIHISSRIQMNDSGFVLVDKPAGFTSHDVVAKLRRRFGTRRVGHGGTLDPMATGLLVVGLNAATKTLQFITDADKEYIATVRLGQSTLSDDAEGEILAQTDASTLDEKEIRAAFASQVGEILQKPSAVSAIKQAGVRAYDRVRAGESVDLPARPVTITELEILGISSVQLSADLVVQDVQIRVACSKGTYIRSIARDVGQIMQVGGHLTALRRTRIGAMEVDDSNSFETAPLIPLTESLGNFMPIHSLTPAEVGGLQFGKSPHWPSELNPDLPAIGLLDPVRNRIVGIGKQIQTSGQPMIGFHAVLQSELE